MKNKTIFEPLRNERAFESIAKQIKETIFSGKLGPGDKLPTERELAEIFNASRVSVRSALLNLEQSGLLNIRKGAGGGFFVRDFNSKPVRDSMGDLLKLGKTSIADLTEARLIIEPQASGLAAKRATSDDLEKIEYAILDFQQRIAQNLPPDPADLNFHVCVAEASKNPVLILIMRSLMELLFQNIGSYFLSLEGNKRIANQHMRVFEAIRRKEPEDAQALMLKHVKDMRALFRRYEIEKNRKSKKRR